MFPGIDTWQSQTIALLAPGRKPLTYEGLVAHAELTGTALKSLASFDLRGLLLSCLMVPS